MVKLPVAVKCVCLGNLTGGEVRVLVLGAGAATANPLSFTAISFPPWPRAHGEPALRRGGEDDEPAPRGFGTVVVFFAAAAAAALGLAALGMAGGMAGVLAGRVLLTVYLVAAAGSAGRPGC